MPLTIPISIINEIKNKTLLEKSVYILIFLFPVLSLSVRHWLSGIFSLLALISLIYFFVSRKKLYVEEKLLLWIFFAFICSFLLSATLNDWSPNSLRRTGTEFKYLLFFPLYIMLRQFIHLRDILLYGTILGGIALGLHAIYDVIYTSHGRGWGIYGPIIFGDLAVLYFSISTSILIYKKNLSPFTALLILSIILSLIASYLSGTRNAWVALIVNIPILLLLFWQTHKSKKVLFSYLALVLTTFIIALVSVTTIKDRSINAYNEFTTFIQYGAEEDYDLINSSVGFRLGQWRAATQIFQEAPFFGYGAGNASKQVNRHVEKGLAHKDLYNPKAETGIGGLHSTYFDALVNEGVIGLIILFIFLLYPIYIFIKLRKYDQLTSSLGLLLILNYMIFGTTENPFVHDNFSSVYLIFIAVLFSYLVKAKYSTD